MPKKGKTVVVQLPDREEAICQRFREIRKYKQWTQTEFAKELGISRDRVASYEYARAPVKYYLGMIACMRADVSPRWLADGSQPMFGYYDSPDEPKEERYAHLPFSQVYDKFLSATFSDTSEDAIRSLLSQTDLRNAAHLLAESWANVLENLGADDAEDLLLDFAVHAASMIGCYQSDKQIYKSWKAEYEKLLSSQQEQSDIQI
ncbi:hypothetical protein DDZ13_07390 [Coraliomargarita sinensis]|uniref:HTH cro/C1-type domain-containing protein n=1 Tax=Coraliomargarita sinensis TaxID=2174842 RepID=A0A317ZK75_9BACT|nr:helix-turn-helix transcriptional regulator [Coraliomargarita sinensis]PXA04348.1 hypothetical protein DDZ13_07390 [Coraliomargarita sinensis]